MKKIFVFLLFSCFVVPHSFARGAESKNGVYKSLASFNKDTLGYYLYNFVEQKDSLKGKSLSDLLTKLEVPVKYYFVGADADPKNAFNAATLLFCSKNRKDSRAIIDTKNGVLYMLVVRFSPTVPFTLLNDYIKTHGDALSSDQYSYFSEYIIKEVEFVAYPQKEAAAPAHKK